MIRKSLLPKTYASLAGTLVVLCFAGTQAISYGQRGHQLWEQGKMAESQAAYEKALAQAKGQDDLPLQARYSLNLAHALLALGNPEASIDHIVYGEIICRKLGDQRGLAMAYIQMGRAKLQQEQADSARLQLGKAKSLFASLKDSPGEMLAVNELGVAYLATGDYDMARVQFEEAFEFNLRKKRYAAAAANQSNIGKTYLKESNYALAKQSLQRALDIDRQRVGVAGRSTILLNMAIACSAEGSCQEAKFYLQRADALGIPPRFADQTVQILQFCPDTE